MIRFKKALRRAAVALVLLIFAFAIHIGLRFTETGPGFGEDGFTWLTFSCGNGVCEPGKGESSETCRADCPEAAEHAAGFYADLARCREPGEIFYPSTVDEVQEAVRSLVRRGKRVKARGTGHSLARNFCSDGGVIVLAKLRGISEIERWHDLDTVVVEPGVTFEMLGEHLHERGRSFGFYATGWGAIGVVGSMSTGSHGSHTHGASTIGEMLVEVTLVDAHGEKRTFNKFDADPETFRAIAAHDGALGVVVRARLATQPDRRVRLRIDERRIDEIGTAEGLRGVTAGCDYAYLALFLGDGRALVACGAVTSDPVTHERLTNYLFSPKVSGPERDLWRSLMQLTAVSRPVEHFLEGQLAGRFLTQSVGIEPDRPGGQVQYVGTEGVGYNHRIINIPRFAYATPHFSQLDYEVAVRARDLPEVIDAVRRIFGEHGRSLPHTGLIIRFDAATDTALLSGNAVREGVAAGEPMAHVEMPVYMPFGFREEALEAHFRPAEASIRHILEHFPTARLHRGKNRPELFELQASLGHDRAQIARFQAIVDRMDPRGVFANEHLRSMGIRWPREAEAFTTQSESGDARGDDGNGGRTAEGRSL